MHLFGFSRNPYVTKVGTSTVARLQNVGILPNFQKMQLDVDVSPPANIMTFRPGLTHLTFDLDPRDL